jgi:hypothetical protein
LLLKCKPEVRERKRKVKSVMEVLIFKEEPEIVKTPQKKIAAPKPEKETKEETSVGFLF